MTLHRVLRERSKVQNIYVQHNSMKIRYFIGGKNMKKRKPLTLKHHNSVPLWMASLTWWTWVWVSSGCWRWTGMSGVLQSMGSQRVGHDRATELNWWKKRGSQAAQVVKNLPASANDKRDIGSIPRSGRSPGEGKDNPLQYSLHVPERAGEGVHGVLLSCWQWSFSHQAGS